MQIDDREWFEADGLGGFASGTVSGVRTRRYHALLLTATTPPTGRSVLVNGFEAWADVDGRSTALTTQRYAPDVLFPGGATRKQDIRRIPLRRQRRGAPVDVGPRLESVHEDAAAGRRRRRRQEKGVVAPRSHTRHGAGRKASEA